MKYRVQVSIRRYVTVEVEVPDYEHMYAAAIAAAKADTTVPLEYATVAGSTVQLSEPWVNTCGWYDLHGPENIIVIERAIGNAFTVEDILLLRRRLKQIDLKVEEHWNGAGCGTVSFRCSGRVGARKMSKADIDVLIAPRKPLSPRGAANRNTNKE